MHRLIDINRIPQVRRDGIWRDAVCDSFVRVECRSDGSAGLHGRLESGLLGGLHVARVTSSPQLVERTRETAAQATESFMLMSIQLRGRTLIRQARSEALLTPGCVGFYETSRPFTLSLPSDFDQIVLHVPTDVFERNALGAVDRTAQRIDASNPYARALVALSGQLVSVANSAVSQTTGGLETIAIELMSLAASTLGSDHDEVPDLAQVGPNAIVWRARDLISKHASNRSLDPDKLAARTGVSLRRLQTLFHEQGSSISEEIWDMRLEHARSLLSEDRFRNQSLTEIAFEAGFVDFAHFSRRFKKRYGLAPREYRSGSR
ncbi:helix-turn-helix domain-containing protein [Bradyrhizobium sp. KB893862 SZCCT0404]|uniref:AraC-like ligand-binding domain-containing protein n=1 Tax=Bradyrhizobium sp. KB893862 SZCCT0404 TaxID=2807672 RepID=UPI001BAD29C4|nr:helix-turn-helix domain-containing protein [Bradyrhizobium sp. KB893862 SZCCT0404]MBR1177036.1 helix-turn-helix domain-containing protein [Bradyrhizobium sp. KB893862 SZCCT0404]